MSFNIVFKTVNVKKFKKAWLKGGSIYDSLKDSHKSLCCRW